MSKSTHLLGKTSGRVGATVFKIVHGQQIVQEYQPKITNPNSVGQQNTRARFKLMSQLSAVMAPLAAFEREKLTSPRNVFVRENFRNTIANDGTAAAALLDFQFAKGTLPGVAAVNINRESEVMQVSVTKPDGVDVLYVLYFTREKDGSLALYRSAQMYEQSAGSSTYSDEYLPTPKETFVYVYGAQFKNDAGRTAYNDYIVDNGVEVANLISNHIIGSETTNFSKTVCGHIDSIEDVTYNIQVYSQNAQMGTVAKTVDSETGRVTLTATPKTGNIFLGWRRSGTQEVISTNPYTFLPVKDETFWGMFLQSSPDA